MLGSTLYSGSHQKRAWNASSSGGIELREGQAALRHSTVVAPAWKLLDEHGMRFLESVHVDKVLLPLF